MPDDNKDQWPKHYIFTGFCNGEIKTIQTWKPCIQTYIVMEILDNNYNYIITIVYQDNLLQVFIISHK